MLRPPFDHGLTNMHVCSGAQNCTASIGGVLCNGYLLDYALHAAIAGGDCVATCEISQLQGCASPPAIFTVILPPAPAPAPGVSLSEASI